VVLKRSWTGEIRNVSVLVAIGIGTDGFRHILAVAEGQKEDLEGWRGFLLHLKERGLSGFRLIISDACRGLAEAAAEVFPDADWQRCVVGLLKNPAEMTSRNRSRKNFGRCSPRQTLQIDRRGGQVCLNRHIAHSSSHRAA
jgi:transposase-like protein